MVMQNQQWATYMKICIEQKSKSGKFLMMCKGDMDLYWELLKLDGSFNLIDLYMQQLIFSILSKFFIWIVVYFNLNLYILYVYLFIRYKIVIGFILIPTLLQVKKWDLDFMKWLKGYVLQLWRGVELIYNWRNLIKLRVFLEKKWIYLQEQRSNQVIATVIIIIIDYHHYLNVAFYLLLS